MDQRWFRQALDGFGRRLERVGPDSWDGPTPCTEWNVRQLVNHVVGELWWVAPLFRGMTIAEVGDRFDGDVLGEDPHGAFVAARADALAAVEGPGVLEQIVHLSFGDVPGGDYLGQLTTDATIHTWDLARALSLDDRLDADLVGVVYDFLAPQAELWRGAGIFAPACDAGPNAGRQEQLIALTGRRPLG